MNDKIPMPIFKKIMTDNFINLINDYHRVQEEEFEKLRWAEFGCSTKEAFIQLLKKQKQSIEIVACNKYT